MTVPPKPPEHTPVLTEAPGLARFLGGSPAAIAIKLIVASVIVGALMHVLNLTPVGLFSAVTSLVDGVIGLGADLFREGLRYIAYGAAVVIPVFLIARLLASRRG